MNATRSGFVYLLALLVVLVSASIAAVMASGAGLRLHAGNDAVARSQCRAAAVGVLRAVINDLTVSQAGGGMPGLVTVQPGGELINGCEVVLLGRDPAATAVSFDLIAEAGRLDINRATVDQMAALPGMTTAIAAAIVDWRDVDDIPDPAGGAERSDPAYHAAAVPYAPRNAPCETIDELRLVRGVTDALFFGEDANGDGKLTLGLRDLLTLDSREPVLGPDGNPRVNIRQANELRAKLVALFGAKRGGELATKAGATQPFANRLDLIAALEATDDESARLWPYLADANRLGLLDAWSCRDEVLTAMLGADLAKAIVAARPATRPVGPNWLAKALTRAGAKSLGGTPPITCGSYQLRADILAIRGDGAGWARLDVLIDCSLAAPRVASIRSAESDGWPLPWATPDMLRRHPGTHDLAAFLASGQL